MMFGVLHCSSLYVCGAEGECGEGRGSVWGELKCVGGGEACVCVCVCRCLCLHSTADAWAVLSAMDPPPYLLHTYTQYIATPYIAYLLCTVLPLQLLSLK